MEFFPVVEVLDTRSLEVALDLKGVAGLVLDVRAHIFLVPAVRAQPSARVQYRRSCVVRGEFSEAARVWVGLRAAGDGERGTQGRARAPSPWHCP